VAHSARHRKCLEFHDIDFGTRVADDHGMRKSKSRTLILSIASAAAVLPGCGDSSESTASSDAATQVGPHVYGSVALPVSDAADQATQTPGLVLNPDDAADEPRIIGAVVQPADAGDADAPHLIIGVVVQPADAGDARPFPGVIIKPEDGSANG
jgi:hypothetical protein